MIEKPISLVVDDVIALRAGALRQLRRPGLQVQLIVPGDKLWVREPFYLGRDWDAFAPTAALGRGAQRADYAADLPGVVNPRHGRRRFAREMPRALSRMHLAVLAVRCTRLTDLTHADAVLEGARDCDDFARRWDDRQAGGRTISGDAARWQDNPRVTVVTFDLIAEALA